MNAKTEKLTKPQTMLKIIKKLKEVQQLTQDELWALIGKSRAQSYKVIKEFTQSQGEVDALLTLKEKVGNTKVYELSEAYK